MRLPCQQKELADRAEHAKLFPPCEHTPIGRLARLLQRWRQGWQGACIVIPLMSHQDARVGGSNRDAVTCCSGSPNLGLANTHKSRNKSLQRIASSRRLSTERLFGFEQSKPATAQGQRKFLCVFKKKRHCAQLVILSPHF